MVSSGLARGKSNSTVFHRQSTCCRCSAVHGVDVDKILSHVDHDLKGSSSKMSRWYHLMETSSGDRGDDSEQEVER